MNDRDRAISEGLDWCVNALDALNNLPPDVASLLGIELVRSWKRRYEALISQLEPQEAQP